MRFHYSKIVFDYSICFSWPHHEKWIRSSECLLLAFAYSFFHVAFTRIKFLWCAPVNSIQYQEIRIIILSHSFWSFNWLWRTEQQHTRRRKCGPGYGSVSSINWLTFLITNIGHAMICSTNYRTLIIYIQMEPCLWKYYTTSKIISMHSSALPCEKNMQRKEKVSEFFSAW